MRRAKSIFTATVLLVASELLFSPVVGQEKVSSDTVARVVKLLEGSGYQYSKLSQTAWSTTFRGKNKSSVNVLIIPDRDDLVFLSVIADREQLDDNVTALRQLLKANAALPEGVSVMLDGDDDYIVQSRSSLKPLNGAAFKMAILTVANAADDIYGSAFATSAPVLASAASNGVAPAFTAPPAATQRVEVLSGRGAVSVTPNLWRETKSTETGRRTFVHRNGDGYAVVISERIQVQTNQLRNVALENAREAAPDVKIVEEQRRRVNGTDVLMLRLEGTTNGVAFTYLGYYYGGPAGTVQVLTYTGRNLFQEYRADFEDFLNGFQLK
jgi:hypothetical protein